MSVYVVDFGEFIKIGMSGQPDIRIKVLEKTYNLPVIRYFYRNFSDSRLAESLTIEALKEFSFPVGAFPSETFRYPYKKAVKALALARNVKGRGDLAKYIKAIEDAIKDGVEPPCTTYGDFRDMFILSDKERSELAIVKIMAK